MAKAAQVLKASLQKILVQASEADLEADEYQIAIFEMNNLMLALDAEGIQLGYTTVSDLGDDITVPTGALRGLISNLAIELAPYFNGKVSAGLVKSAKEGMDAMRQLGQRIAATAYPNTLPIGSGNECTGSLNRASYYFPDEEAEILAETTGAIGLEDGTEAAIEGE